MDIGPLFCEIADFCVSFELVWRAQALSVKQRQRPTTMHLSEVLTILVWYHRIG